MLFGEIADRRKIPQNLVDTLFDEGIVGVFLYLDKVRNLLYFSDSAERSSFRVTISDNR